MKKGLVEAARLLLLMSWAGLAPLQASAQLLPPLPLPGSLIVTITSPTSGSNVSGTVTVNASVSIVGSLTVAGVQFFLDGAPLGAEDTAAPYAVPWNTTTTNNGSHVLTAVARDLLGIRFTSNPVTVTVANAPPPPPPDATPPTVSLTAPANGATVSGIISVTATASDNVGVVGVQFQLDGANLGAEDTTVPYSRSWDTTTTANGSHTLTAVARDAAGNRTTSAGVTVTVSNGPPPDTTPPTVSITAPANGTTVSGTITVSASAADNVGVVGVQFFVDGAPLGAEDPTAPYAVSWDTTAASNGSHTLTAVARDAAGNRTTSALVTVTVSNGPPPDATPPTAGITTPASGETVSGTITVSATASDNVGVVGVQFLLDGVTLGVEDTAAPYSITWDTTTAANGPHTLTAVARDAAGNTGTSAPVTVTVSNGGPPPDTAPPTAAITSPIDGTTISGTITITADASDNVGVASVQFFVDGALLGTEDTAAPYSRSWDTTTTINGTHTLTAVARDTAGNTGASAPVTVTVFNGGTTTTRFEEDNSAIRYDPATAWIRRGPEIAAFSGGTAVTSDQAGASATLTFTGTAINWIGLKCSICGIASVSIDGGAAVSVDTAGSAAPGSSGLTSETVFTASGLTAGDHTIVIAVTGTTTSGGAHIAVDAFDVTGSGGEPPPTATRIEDTDTAVSYTGNWFHGTDPRATAGTFAEAFETDSRATLNFTGTAIRWIGYRYFGGGIARVYVDGTLMGEVDTYAPSVEEQAVVFTASGLPQGAHTLTIEVTGTMNPAASMSWIIVDAFDVTP